MNTTKADMSKTEAFARQVVSDIAATFSGVMTRLGHRLCLYKAMAGAGQMSTRVLAEKTGMYEHYAREWLNNQAAGGYVSYDPESRSYTLPDEHIPVLVDEDSPMFLVPALDVTSSLWLDEDQVAEVFRSGRGIAWSAHHHRLFCGSEALFRPGYKANLTTSWIRSLDGVEDKLSAGAKVADVGCGHGASTIDIARERAREAGVAGQQRLSDVLQEAAGFGLVRRTAQTVFNMWCSRRDRASVLRLAKRCQWSARATGTARPRARRPPCVSGTSWFPSGR